MPYNIGNASKGTASDFTISITTFGTIFSIILSTQKLFSKKYTYAGSSISTGLSA